jgi:hypothetical protein
MPQRFELIGKSKATVVDIDIQAMKMGQVDVQPAVCLTLRVPRPNAALSMIDATLRDFLYANNAGKPKVQAQLEGVEVVSDKPNLTPAAEALGAIHWEYEQSGCSLKIYNGVSGHGDIKLKDGTVRKLKLEPKEGGTVDCTFQFYTSDVDAETIGELGVLKSLERDIELTAPEIISAQKDIEEEDTPEKAARRAHGVGAKAAAKPAKKTPLAKKVARSTHARKTKAH